MSTEVKHIARLQERNRLLAECLADERKLRQEAHGWYRQRLQSRFWSLLDCIALAHPTSIWKIKGEA